MIDFVVVSSDLRPYVLDTRGKRGAELSTDHHLAHCQHCVWWDGALLTSTRDVVSRWGEYFEDLLNPTDTRSEEAESESSETGPPISGT